MTGIAGISRPGKSDEVHSMLAQIAHRGQNTEIIELEHATLGVVYPEYQSKTQSYLNHLHAAVDGTGNPSFVLALKDKILLQRDPLGIAPLYYGWTKDRVLCFSSEVKGLIKVTCDVHELPPGHMYDGERVYRYFLFTADQPVPDQPDGIACELYKKLDLAVQQHVISGNEGAWLSGGLDSSALSALACRYIHPFHTFTVGMPGAPDVTCAQEVADYIGSEHHVHTVEVKDLLEVLPDVIYHLESFDAWLVRSSIMNYLVARLASDFVPAVFSGEGGDELFAGYSYLKSLDIHLLQDELLDITMRLHNTALQRVDRSAAAHGIAAHVVFLDRDVLEYAFRIPAQYKIYQGIEKWILRQAVADILPATIVNREKSKFWQGAGVEDVLAVYAESQISDNAFRNERQLPNGWVLNTKEELLYYRIFCEHFGKTGNLLWMGRTKGSPVS